MDDMFEPWEIFQSSGSLGNKECLTLFFTHTHTHTPSHVTVCPLTSLWVYTSIPNIVLWLWGGTVNHDVLGVFRGLSGKVCECVYVSVQRAKERERERERLLLQPESALWCWLALTSTMWPFRALTHLWGAHQEHTHTLSFFPLSATPFLVFSVFIFCSFLHPFTKKWHFRLKKKGVKGRGGSCYGFREK